MFHQYCVSVCVPLPRCVLGFGVFPVDSTLIWGVFHCHGLIGQLGEFVGDSDAHDGPSTLHTLLRGTSLVNILRDVVSPVVGVIVALGV